MIASIAYQAVVGALIICAGLYYFWRRRMDGLIAESADMEWEKLNRRDPELLKGLDRAGFDKLYAKAEYPRLPGYLVATFAAVTLLTPVILFALQIAFSVFGGDGVAPEIAESTARLVIERDGGGRVVEGASDQAKYYAQDLGGFGYFFGLLAGWLVIVFFFMQRYHRKTPGALRDEILRAR
ncbi:MAG: hypothetical protein AAFR11_10300 [Pseudomonadota bacterium]